jgi:hypothetical protein
MRGEKGYRGVVSGGRCPCGCTLAPPVQQPQASPAGEVGFSPAASAWDSAAA